MKPFWVTRASVRAPGMDFERGLALILTSAARQFGKDTGRLVRDVEKAGRVEIGEVRVVGTSAPAPEGKK